MGVALGVGSWVDMDLSTGVGLGVEAETWLVFVCVCVWEEGRGCNQGGWEKMSCDGLSQDGSHMRSS